MQEKKLRSKNSGIDSSSSSLLTFPFFDIGCPVVSKEKYMGTFRSAITGKEIRIQSGSCLLIITCLKRTKNMKFGTCITTLNNLTLIVRTSLASTESYRLLIKYACCKGQDLSQNKSSKLYGFSNTYKQESKINSALNDLKKMKEAVDLLAKVKD